MNEFIQEARRIWSELGLNQKISIILAFVGVLAGMSVMVMWSSKPDMQLLYGRLDNKDMAEVITLLDQLAVPYKMEAGGTSVFVPSDKVYSMRMQLASKGVPSGGGVGFEIFDQSNFGISDFIQRTNYNRAIQGELARTIMQLKGVRSARVMVVVPENRILAEANKIVPTASVFVDTGSMKLTEEAVNSIRFLVANSVQGLNVDDVAVVDNTGNVLSENLKSDKTLGIASSQMRYKQGLEEYYVKKIESMLGKVVGSGSVVARVAVEVESDASKVFEEKFDPEGQVVRSQTLTEDSTNNKETSSGQVVGQQGSGQAANTGGNGTTNTSEVNRKNKTIAYEINRSTVELVKNPGKVKRISAAVFLEKRTIMEGGKMVEKARSPEELKMVKLMVANALGISEEMMNQISVEEMAFQVPANASGSLMDMGSAVIEWTDIAKKFMSIVLALVVFMTLFKMLKKYKPQVSSLSLVEGSASLGARNITPHATPDLLNELIRQKPDNISTALKNWIANNEDK